MKIRYFLISLFIVTSLCAQTFSSRYEVEVTLFQKVGYADVLFIEDGQNYEIKLIATTIGAAATLLKHRTETFTSKGKIIDGRYVPDVFIKTKETTNRSRTQTYYFNHEKREIKLIKEQTKLVRKSTFSLKTKTKSSREEKIEDEYIQDDSLSVYLNTRANCNNKKREYQLYAIGANNDKNSILVSCLDKNKGSEISSLQESDYLYNLNVEPFDKSDSIVDVLVALDSDGMLKEAYMDDIFWVGNIRAKRVHHKVTN
ncbi:MAG TPA: DUF3108 domain-containing protein [Sulfurimonas sp.]|uniref:DUF3108 domain-containing protein n=1 Tax=Sulfurimonas sp. TaxID=2022749 RepID=UPI002D197B76|nr:DUF3108 domain-containing protein [Sulfurimonas sp.]HUH42089.1 DUF3108 domain-containing protein [Sulfurimonas sp.]